MLLAGCGSAIVAEPPPAAAPVATTTPSPPEPAPGPAADTPAARALPSMWNTFYFVSRESDHRGPRDTQLHDSECRPIATVSRAFAGALCIEGSGLLDDGRVVNYARRCTESCPAAPTCGSRPVRVCYVELDPARYPHGMGAGSAPLTPDRSAAVDPDFVALGQWLYVEELDGVVPPGSTEPHDGCLRAEDTGGGIESNHIDIFAGTRDRWLEWERILPTRSRLTVWLDHPRCAGRGGSAR